MKNNGHTQVLGYINVDWAGNTLDRKLTTDIVYLLGKIQFHGKVKINWLLLASAQKQNIVLWHPLLLNLYR